VVRDRRLTDDAGLDLGEVVDHVVGYPPDGFVWRVDPIAGRARFAVPRRPGVDQTENVIDHAGHDVGRVALIGLGTLVCHDASVVDAQ
jgi:hypothetical protein